MAKTKPASPFIGVWHIISMSGWNKDIINEEGQAFIEFGPKGLGEFHFGTVYGDISFVKTQRDGQAALEWTWEGGAEMDELSGRGWAILERNDLHGMIFFDGGDRSDFVAKRAKRQPRLNTRKRK